MNKQENDMGDLSVSVPEQKQARTFERCSDATKCANMKETYSGFDGERYRCGVCGQSYFLDYEEMR